VLIELEVMGPGIPRGNRDRLFQPFVTAGKQDGLGLALSRQTVLNHGGDIWSEPATGARFVMRLPLNRAQIFNRKAHKSFTYPLSLLRPLFVQAGRRTAAQETLPNN
jgi:K+-sensing histidine kinase KdpD